MITVPTNIVGDLTATLKDQLADTGLFAFVALIAGILLAFFVIERLIKIPREMEEKKFREEIEWYEFIKKEDPTITEAQAMRWAKKRVREQTR